MDQSYWKESGRAPDYLILSFQNDDVTLMEMELDVTLGDYSLNLYDILFRALDIRTNALGTMHHLLCKEIPDFELLPCSEDLEGNLSAMFLLLKVLLEDNGCYTDNKLTYNYSERIADGILLEKRCKATYTPSNNTDNNILD